MNSTTKTILVEIHAIAASNFRGRVNGPPGRWIGLGLYMNRPRFTAASKLPA